MLSKDFKEFVALLNAHGAKYLVVGGYAMAVHGRPRQTGDLDIWLKRDHANALTVVAALQDFGFGDLGLTVKDFEVPDQVVQLGYPPFRIDLLTGIDGVDFDSAWQTRFEYAHGDLKIPFIGLEALKANKRASARPRDIDDLENLP
ncbi:MAG: hypothetical protein KJ787_06845 [Gammaproteobacteria bacterium]|nr:hypothetical protein [Gammaproteobacteria bacterium]MBU1646035.1 hypothetical protein [Gammaproteobacteria bacterium]MBU1972097.1 hypothetical protein [Gammaproteobacteria bacterium]